MISSSPIQPLACPSLLALLCCPALAPAADAVVAHAGHMNLISAGEVTPLKPFKAGDLMITGVWARATVPSADAGVQLPLILRFKHAGTATVQVQVVPISAMAPAGMDEHMPGGHE